MTKMILLKTWLERGTEIKCGPTDGMFKTETAACYQLVFFHKSPNHSHTFFQGHVQGLK